MNRYDNKVLISFITRIGMYINPVDGDNIISFITGYIIGRKKCNFIELLQVLLSEKYKINLLSYGRGGQIEKLAKRRKNDWVTAFRELALEVILDTENDIIEKPTIKILKSRVIGLVNQIELKDGYLSNSTYRKNEWSIFCDIKQVRLKKLWTREELGTIRKINKIKGTMTSNKKMNKKTIDDLLILKTSFLEHIKK